MTFRRSAVPTASAAPAAAAPPFAAATAFVRIRRVLNFINLSTPAGLTLALAGKCRISRGPDGLLLAGGWTWPLPRAAAFTVGNVILYRSRVASSFRPGHSGFQTGGFQASGFQASGPRTVRPDPSRLLRHESRHSTQYALLGQAFLPLYFLAAGISALRTGDPASGNIFERLAGLEDGGYRRPA